MSYGSDTAEKGQVEAYSNPSNLEHGQHHDARLAPVNGGGFTDPYHYSNHEDVKFTLPRGLAYASLSILFGASQLTSYFLGACYSWIVKDVGGSHVSSWYLVSYGLALGSICPFTGYLSDILSRRYVAMLGQSLDCLGTLLIATAHSPAQVIIGSTLAGMGGGIGEMSAQSGLGKMAPRKDRGIVAGLMNAPTVPFLPYVLYCNLLGESRWRICFFISVAYNLSDLVMLALFYHPPSEPFPEGVTRRTILRQIDYLGGILVIGGVILVLYSLSKGQSIPWTHAEVLAPFFAGIALILAFLIWETKATLPLVPMELFQANPRVIALTLVITASAGANFHSLSNFLPLLVSTVWDASDPTKVGLRALGADMATFFGALAFAPLISRFPRHTRYIMLAASIMMTAFIGGLCGVNPNGLGWWYPVSTLAGFGLGANMLPAATIAVIAAPDDMIATVTAFTLATRSVGGSIGTAVYFNVLTKEIPKALPREFVPRLLKAGLPSTSLTPFIKAYYAGDMKTIASIPGVTSAVLEAGAVSLRWVYSDALRQVFLVSIAFGSIAIIASAFLGNIEGYVDGNQGVDVHRMLHSQHKNSPE